jgi:hypothetical protein
MFRRIWQRIGIYYGWLKLGRLDREISKKDWKKNKGWIMNEPFKSTSLRDIPMTVEQRMFLEQIFPPEGYKKIEPTEQDIQTFLNSYKKPPKKLKKHHGQS